MERLKVLFADKLVEDDREPILTFSGGNIIPFLSSEEKFELLAPNPVVWRQLFTLLLLQVFFQCTCAAINYKFIIQQRRQQNRMATYMIGWGFMIPIALYFPFLVVDFFDIQNKTIRMSAASPAFIVVFRTIEAMYETSPNVVETSVMTYVIYYTTLLHFHWDPVTKTRRKVTSQELLSLLGQVVLFMHLLSLMLSFEMHYDFTPFPSPFKLEEFHLDWDLLSPAHLGNAYFLAVLTYLTLQFGFDFTAFGEQAKGYYTQPIFSNPLFTSRSPSEFWSRKWNLMVHRILKFGTFLPAKKFVSTNMAILLTFIMSGLVHEYTWSIMFYQHDHVRNEDGKCLDCFVPIALKLTAFFAWNGVVMLLERPLGKYFAFTETWPTVVVSTTVVLTALPVSHWYSGDWARGGYFEELSLGLWLIRKAS